MKPDVDLDFEHHVESCVQCWCAGHTDSIPYCRVGLLFYRRAASV